MLEIRPYRHEDREAVRAVAVATAYLGGPIEPYYAHRDSMADILTAYYTDHESDNAWVVCHQGRVAGYLLGCLDSRRAPAAEWVAIRAIMKHWLWLRPGTAAFCWRSLLDVVRDAGSERLAVDHDRYPAHCHIDLLPEARKGAVALRLFRTWQERAARCGVRGSWGVSFVENEAAAAFHRALGFEPHGAPYPFAGMRTPDGKRMHCQTWLRTQRLPAANPQPHWAAAV